MKQLLCLLLFITACTQPQETRTTQDYPPEAERAWWKEGVVYQIYPRSFQDTDGDGVGDLRGIINRLDYLKSLGIDIIWLNPVYASPNDDNGYDISDYQAILPEFGSMEDFAELMDGLHARDMKLVMDLVVNHSSDEHAWFEASRGDRNSPYRDFYHWWPEEKGEPPFRKSFFDIAGNAWQYDSTTNAYYLHYFSDKQPDLKWENPETRQAIYEMMNWWFQKGIDGFRMDVIPFISKDTTYPVVTEEELRQRYGADTWARYYADGPNLHTYLHEMNEEVLSKYDIMALGEGAGVTIGNALKFVDPEREELDLFYHFDGVNLGYSNKGYKQLKPEGWSLQEFKQVYSDWSNVFAEKGWGSIYLGNHDQPRMVSRWGNDDPGYHQKAVTLLQTFLLSMRATPFFYYGDEIGMTNIRFKNISDYRDIETLNWYRQLEDIGEDPDDYMTDWEMTARDNGRTSMQWSSGPQAGFTSGQPWISINPNADTLNVEQQEKDPNSVLNYFRKIVNFRKAEPILGYGDYKLLSPEHEEVYAYTRSLEDEQLLVLLNFSTLEIDYGLPARIKPGIVRMNNYAEAAVSNQRVRLQPYQALILEVE